MQKRTIRITSTPRHRLVWSQYDQVLEQGKTPPPVDPVVQLSCGAAHTLVVTRSGRLYSFGYDEGEGRLGILEKWQEGPRRVHFANRPDLKIVQAAAGHKHSAVLDSEGMVRTCIRCLVTNIYLSSHADNARLSVQINVHTHAGVDLWGEQQGRVGCGKGGSRGSICGPCDGPTAREDCAGRLWGPTYGAF